MLDVSALRVDGDTQPRAAIDPAVVAEYAEALEAGAEFPPVEVVGDGAAHWLVDGFHRFYAHRKLGRKQIRAVISTGMLEDARWRSLGANKTHGLRRTNADKAKAVRKALKLRADLSDRAIAEQVGVSNDMVGRYRATMEGQVSQYDNSRCSRPTPCRVGRDGKRYPARRNARCKGRISRKAFKPVRTGSKPLPMTALNMPHDPVMGARTLIELFDADYLRALTTFLTKHLEGAEA
jgi:hypothetical protein